MAVPIPSDAWRAVGFLCHRCAVVPRDLAGRPAASALARMPAARLSLSQEGHHA